MPLKFKGTLNEASPSTQSSRLAWSELAKSDTQLKDFLDKHPPSTTQRSASGDGWIWVQSKRTPSVAKDCSKGDRENQVDAIKGAEDTLKGLITRCEEIDANSKIPKVKTKTSGPSKRMIREEATKEAEAELRKFGGVLPTGKWLFFESPRYVDIVFQKLAQSVIDGPLSKLKNANCHTVKAATAGGKSSGSRGRDGDNQQLICLYFDDVWDRDHAMEVLECVVREHGQIPNSAKPDLYTYIDLTSGHPSKIRSTLYRPGELINDDVMREWKEDFFEREKQDPKTGSSSKAGPSKVQSGLPQPIDPATFWPDPAQDAEDDFEEDGADGSNQIKTVATETKGSATNGNKESDTKSMSAGGRTSRSPTVPDVGKADDTDDSETESEDEYGNKAHYIHYMPSKVNKVEKEEPAQATAKSSKPSAGSSSVTASSPPRTSPAASPAQKKAKLSNRDAKTAEREARPEASTTSSKGKAPAADARSPEVIKSTPVVKLSRQRKRDRFGRNDF